MILTELKQATRSYHDAIEKELDLFNRTVSCDDYAFLLSQFFGFYAPLEARLELVAGLTDVVRDFSARRKTLLLRLDLADLGYDLEQVEVLPRCADLPALESIPQALGCLYVMEGATLGGQVISRHLQQNLGIDGNCGGHFFSSYGASVGAMWRGFGDALQAFCSASQSEEIIIRSACGTFAAFGRWFKKGNTREQKRVLQHENG